MCQLCKNGKQNGEPCQEHVGLVTPWEKEGSGIEGLITTSITVSCEHCQMPVTVKFTKELLEVLLSKCSTDRGVQPANTQSEQFCACGGIADINLCTKCLSEAIVSAAQNNSRL